MNERAFNILLATLQSGILQHYLNGGKFDPSDLPENCSREDFYNTCYRRVIAHAVCIDRTLADNELAEITAVDSFKCPENPALNFEHQLESANGRCIHCKKKWSGTKWII